MADKTDPLKTRNVGDHPAYVSISVQGSDEPHMLFKDRDLRYGINPTQTAAEYSPKYRSFLGRLREVKSGKQGPSQTNMEDVFYAAVTVGCFKAPTVAIMKHTNPSGVATQYAPEPLSLTFRKARDADFRAAFGGTVFSNEPVDMETANVMRETFVEVVAAPGYDTGVVGRFAGTSTRMLEYYRGMLDDIPRFVGDNAGVEIKLLADGTMIRSDPY